MLLLFFRNPICFYSRKELIVMIGMAICIISLVSLIFIGVCMIDYYIARKKSLNRLFLFELDRILDKNSRKSDKRRNASEMATIIRLIEDDRKHR